MTSVLRVPAAGATLPPRRRSRWSAVDALWALLFIGPNFALFTLFIVLPILAALALSLFDWNLISAPRFVGFANFAMILDDARALNSIVRTAYLVVGGVLPTIVIAFLIAVLINTKFPGIRVFRTLYLMPIVISFVASAVLWNWIFDPRGGPINGLLGLFGIAGPDWMNSTFWSMPAVTIVMVWLRLPVAILLYLAAVQGINPSLLEAAKIDGAGALARLRFIIWPAVRPVTLFVTVITLRGVLFDSFDVVQVMTNGGPLGSTDILIKYIYDAAFDQLRLGYASALATVLFVIVAGIAAVVMPFSRRGAADGR
jgi:ABC-type sugar transport system permease subunit